MGIIFENVVAAKFVCAAVNACGNSAIKSEFDLLKFLKV